MVRTSLTACCKWPWGLKLVLVPGNGSQATEWTYRRTEKQVWWCFFGHSLRISFQSALIRGKQDENALRQCVVHSDRIDAKPVDSGSPDVLVRTSGRRQVQRPCLWFGRDSLWSRSREERDHFCTNPDIQVVELGSSLDVWIVASAVVEEDRRVCPPKHYHPCSFSVHLYSPWTRRLLLGWPASFSRKGDE